MTYASNNLRNALIAVAGTILFSSLFLASAVGPAIVA